MKFLNQKKNQIIITIIYPVIVFGVLSIGNILDSWTIPIVITLLFCLLWSKVRYVIISTILMWAISFPLWLFLIVRSREDQGYAILTSSLPFIVLPFIFIFLIPEILIVIFKNYLIDKLTHRHK